MQKRLKLIPKNDNKTKKNLWKTYGKIRPLFLALLILVSGLLLDSWWWQVGMAMLVAMFIGGYYRYRSPQ